jgi:hypothetical protein
MYNRLQVNNQSPRFLPRQLVDNAQKSYSTNFLANKDTTLTSWGSMVRVHLRSLHSRKTVKYLARF